MALPLALGIASLFFTGVSVIQQLQAANKSEDLAEEQKRENEANRRLAEIRNRRARVQEIRKQRIARATILSSAEGTGTSKSSGALGGAAAVQSQAAANIGFLTQTEETSQKVFASRGRQSDIGSDISKLQSYGSITGTLGATFSPGLKPLFKEVGD